TGVRFGSVRPSTFTVLSDTTLVATSPPQAAGTVDLTVTSAGGTSATSSSDEFTYTVGSTPSVSAVTPSSGPTRTAVVITGSNFAGASSVNFATTAALFDVLADDTIIAYAPDRLSGTVHITVTTPAGTSSTSSADQFTASAASAASITSLGTTSGSTAGGT